MKEVLMDSSYKYSERIKTIASYISKGIFFADIGTDHAYLPCYVCSYDDYAQAIAGELNDGPYKSAYETVQLNQLDDRISVRQGNGLDVLENDPVEEIVIAGMGGTLIAHILEEGKNYLQTVNRIIAQPNIGEYNVRKWIVNNGFQIANETLIKEKNHIYEIIIAERNALESEVLELDGQEYLLGPLLLKQKSTLFYEKWNSQLTKTKNIKNQIKQSKVRDDEIIAKLNQKIQWIKEAIGDDND